MKKNLRKRMMSLCMVFVMIIGISSSFVGCGLKETAGNNEDENMVLTNAQWITGLASTFGLTEYQSNEPVFEDITSDSEIFAYIQACAEWDIFENVGGKFNPDEPVTREFAVKTAVVAAEVLEKTEDNNIYEQSIEYALSSGLIERNLQSYLQECITIEEGQKILDWALEQFQNREFVEYENVIFQEEVLDLTDKKDLVSLEGDNAIISSELGVTLEVGDVFIAPPTSEDPAGVARKVVSIETDEAGNLIIITQMPELGEVYSELDFAQTVVPQVENVIVHEGATLVAVNDTNYITNVGCTTLGNSMSIIETGTQQVLKSPDFSFNVNFTKGKVSLSKAWETSLGNFKADLEEADIPGDKAALGTLFEKSNVLYEGENDGKHSIQKISNKFTGGYEITGSLTISNISADIEVKTNKLLGIPVGIDKLIIDTNYKISSTLKVKGNLKEELKVATFPIPVGATGATVNIEVILYANANGELAVKTETSTDTTLTYKSGNIKKTSNTISDVAKVELGIDIELGAGVTAKLKIVAIPITDVGVKAGVKFSFNTSLEDKITVEENEREKITTTENIWAMKVKCTYPIVTLSMGAQPDSLIKLNLSWELVGSKGLIKAKEEVFYETEQLLFVNEDIEELLSTETEDSTEVSDAEGDTEIMPNDTQSNTQEDGESGILENAENLNIDVYGLSLLVGETDGISITSIPSGYAESDLRWSSDNSSVATVSNGVVTAVAEGTVTIMVSTSDGKYKVYCSVIVTEETEVEFEPL